MIRSVILVFSVLLVSSCSINKMALATVADGLADGTGSTFTSEGDLDLVCGALPLSLKAMEALVEKVPDNQGLHLSLAGGFLLYAIGCVEIGAEQVKETDFAEYRRLRARARNLCYRAFEYGRRGLALAPEKEEAALLYWTGAALAKWITFSKDDPAAVIRLPEAAGYMERALKAEPDFDRGSLYEFFTAYESRSGDPADTAKAMGYFRKAVKAAEGRKLSVNLTYVECFAIPFQDKKAFESNLKAIMDFDLDTQPEFRLANALAQRRAGLLLKRENDLFLEE